MGKSNQVAFTLKARVEDREVAPSTIGLTMFNQFNREVEEFLAGVQRSAALDDVHPQIKEGSYTLLLTLPVALYSALQPDLKALKREDSLGMVDPKRAEIVQKWQVRAKSSTSRIYEIRSYGEYPVQVTISKTTDYRAGKTTPWVMVEKYLFGRIIDMGGANKANVHLIPEGSAKPLIIVTQQDFLREQKINRLYHQVLVHVQAEEHSQTGELRNLRLLDFPDYDPQYNEEELNAFIEQGTKAWADVPDAAAWVRGLRGGT